MSAKILVVDDEAPIQDILVRILRREGYATVTASNGYEALELVYRERPDLILLDVTMPDMDGFTVCKRIKDDERTALIPVTMLTGLNDRDYRRRGMEVGADDFLTKPFDPNMLHARIRSQLRIKRLTDQLEQTESVIFMLALVVEAKDSYTRGHLSRLSHYSQQLAIAAGLSAKDARAVRYGGLLHDIGKMGIDDTILRKPGPLTAEEYAQIKRHPEYGARIVGPMRFASEVAPIILGHHERWDGKGYPTGLAREEIAIGARIVSIVDAYDAMMTDRPYRRALSRAESLRRLRAGGGEQWDPHLLAIFVDLVEHDKLILPDFEYEYNSLEAAIL